MSGQAGQVKRAPMQTTQARQRMWQSMRVLKRFSVADLVATAETPANSANHYVRALRRAGYLRCVQPVQSGRTAGHARYQLMRDTGPCAPRIGKDAVRDPNTEPTQKPVMVSIPRSEYERALRCIALCTDLRGSGPTEAVRLRALAALEVAR